jgi:hypothetical protein
MKKNKSKATYIAIEDLVSRLGLLEEDVRKWLKKDGADIQSDYRGRPSVPSDFLERYSNDKRYANARSKALLIEKAAKKFDNNERIKQRLKTKRLSLINEYDSYISDLEKIHCKCLDLVNKTGSESAMTAAYLLFSRVISTLKMCCLCQRSDYWYWGSLIREIDESLAVAELFVISKDTSEGFQALHKWFRQNEAPAHTECRKVISTKMSATDPRNSQNNNLDLLYEIYQKKSKFTHPTYLVIREITTFELLNNIPNIKEIEYGQSKHERKLLELTEFFRSSIWTSIQVFIQCFHDLPLDKEDLNHLFSIHSKIAKEEENEFIKRSNNQPSS